MLVARVTVQVVPVLDHKADNGDAMQYVRTYRTGVSVFYDHPANLELPLEQIAAPGRDFGVVFREAK